jgi:hypothetical protein
MADWLAARPAVVRLPAEDDTPAPGTWLWVKNADGDWLGCVTHVGSNYVAVRGVAEDQYGTTRTARVHFDRLAEQVAPAPDAEAIIAGRVAGHQGEVQRLLGEVKGLTGRLAVTSGALTSAPEAEAGALALRTGGESMDDYKAALVRASKEDLPALFKIIEREQKLAAAWMSAPLIPLKARAEGLHALTRAVERRIFSVELYAGLTEKVEQITDGDPAPVGAKVHLMQRRAYMDEECLAQYEVGGMEFKDLPAFDAWLARPANLDRILPFPRCVIGFQVRRNQKERELVDLRDFIHIIEANKLDKLTFLYIRNGDQLFRLSTAIDFGANLFPDMSMVGTSEQLYARTRGGFGFSGGVITEGEFKALQEWDREHAGKKRFPNSMMTESAKAPDYEVVSPASVLYDDVMQHLAEEMDRHNRLVLVLQGLLDRSPVLHPHPPWQLWTPEGFSAGLVLIYDDSRALTTGAAPDFEAYRAACNASLATGSVTVGQVEAWEIQEAERECRRRDNDWRDKGNYRPERWRPHGDPGPGRAARVHRYHPRAAACTFEWYRARAREAWRVDPRLDIRRTLTVPASQLLNADAYRPGDFRRFFDDPRTRADYLRWAPLLLEAEEFYAGNREIKPKLRRPNSEPGT